MSTEYQLTAMTLERVLKVKKSEMLTSEVKFVAKMLLLRIKKKICMPLKKT